MGSRGKLTRAVPRRCIRDPREACAWAMRSGQMTDGEVAERLGISREEARRLYVDSARRNCRARRLGKALDLLLGLLEMVLSLFHR